MLKYSMACLVVLAGCASTPPSQKATPTSGSAPVKQTHGLPMPGSAQAGSMPRVVGKATDADRAALLDRVRGLEGEWLMQGEDGTWNVTCVFKTIAGGSAVREIMFPGTPHEMTNLYHMDGSSLVLTHYCAAGNQPKMRAKAATGKGPIAFEFDSVTNLTQPEETYMGSMTLVMPDADRLEAHWMHHKAGNKMGEPMIFSMKRKK